MKRFLAMLLAVMLVVGVLPMGAMAEEEGTTATGITQGSGTESDPWVIKTEADMEDIKNKNNAGKYFVLGNDITLSNWTVPIRLFKSTLDGNGYTITMTGDTCAALIGSTATLAPNHATVKNLRVVADNVTMKDIMPTASGFATKTQYAALLARTGNNLTVENCGFSGNFTVASAVTLGVGAVFGSLTATPTSAYTDELKNTWSSVSIDANGSTTVGALVGWQYCGSTRVTTISDSYYEKTAEDVIGVGIWGPNGSKVEYTGGGVTGYDTDTMKSSTLVDNLNTYVNSTANAGKGLLQWKAVEGDYPDFAAHKEIQTGKVTLSGTTTVGETLTAEDTLTSEGARGYKWYRVDGEGNETAIEGATAKTYALTEGDKNYKIKVVVTVENAVGGTNYATSASSVKGEGEAELTFSVNVEGAKIVVLNDKNGVEGTGATQTLAKGTYTYYVGKDGYVPASGTVTMDGADKTETVTLTQKNFSGFSSEEDYNMLTGTLSELSNFPTDVTNAKIKWAADTGTNHGNCEPTNAVFALGNLYVAGYSDGKDDDIYLKKLDIETGAVLAKVKLRNTTGWNYFLTTSEDMIFIMEDTKVEAFDAATLTRLWVSEALPGNQGLCPINYSDGFVYGGTCASGEAGFFCLSAKDGKRIWFNKAPAGSDATYTGSYWAGGAIIGDYVVYGTGGGHVYSVNKLTGEIVSQETISTGKDIRSSVAYDEANKKIYFTSLDATLYRADFDASTGKLSNLTSVSFAVGTDDSATATPAILDGKVYVGSERGFAVINAANMTVAAQREQEKVTTSTGEVYKYSTLRDLRLVKDGGKVYAFSTYFRTPGGVVMYCVKGDSITEMDFSTLMDVNWKQYCASMPIFGPDGTIYASNDKGYLMAIRAKAAGEAATPVLTQDLSATKVEYTKGAAATALAVTATASDEGTLSYQWKSSADGETWADIADATESSYTPSTTTVGTTYYCCEVTNTLGGGTAKVTSAAAEIYVKEVSSGGNTEKKTITVYVSYTSEGKFVNGTDRKQTLLYKVPVTVEANDDGKFTMDAAFRQFHEDYGEVSDYDFNAGNGWINDFWGEGSYISLAKDNSWVKNANTTIKNGNHLAVYKYKDQTDYSDLYTWFVKDTYTVKAGNEADFTVNGANLMKSGTSGKATAKPEGATVTVYDSKDRELTELATNTDADGKFALIFTESGTYTVVVSGTCDYSYSSTDFGSGSFEDAVVVPARCKVTVSGGTSGGSTSTDSTTPAEKTEGGETTVNPAVSAGKNGEATANVGSGTMKDAVSDAKSEGSSAIVIEPEIKGEASKVTVNVPVSSAASVGKDAKADLTLKTDVGSITLPAEELKNLSGSGNLTISAEKKENGEVEVNITKGGEDVEMKNVSVTVPSENGKTNTVLVLVHEDGTEEVLKKSAVTEDGVTGLVDGSCTVKAVEVESDFGDTANHWAKDAAEFVANRGIFNGTGSKEFSPDLPMNRAMVATVLHRLENAPEANGKTNYTDKLDVWAEEGIAWATENEIVTGYAGQFNGDRAVTRQELATMLYRYAKVLGLSTDGQDDLSKFADGSSTADWAKEAMVWAVDTQLFTGRTATTLDPTGTATRAEVAVVTERLVKLIVK